MPSFPCCRWLFWHGTVEQLQLVTECFGAKSTRGRAVAAAGTGGAESVLLRWSSSLHPVMLVVTTAARRRRVNCARRRPSARLSVHAAVGGPRFPTQSLAPPALLRTDGRSRLLRVTGSAGAATAVVTAFSEDVPRPHLVRLDADGGHRTKEMIYRKKTTFRC